MSVSAQQVKQEARESTNHKDSPMIFHVEVQPQPKFAVYPKGGSWTPKEISGYLAFLIINEKSFDGTETTVLWENCKRMADFVATRNFRQCKTFHCRQVAQFQTVANIVENLKNSNKKVNVLLGEELQRYELESSKSFQQTENLTSLSRFDVPNFQKSQKQLPRTSDEYNEGNQFPAMRPMAHNLQLMAMNQNNQSSEWIQCHRLFLQWTSRLRQLMTQFSNN